MSPADARALSRIKDHLVPFESGPLKNNVRAHYEHLHHLADGLRKIGIDDETVDRQLLEVFESYKIELLRNIARIEAQSRLGDRGRRVPNAAPGVIGEVS